MTEADLGWAAGFFEGEGYIGCVHSRSTREDGSPANYMRLVTSIAQIDRRSLDKFLAIVKIGRINGPYNHKNKKHTPYYQWCATGVTNLNALYALLAPNLVMKKEQFAEAFKKHTNYREELLANGSSPKRIYRGEPQCST